MFKATTLNLWGYHDWDERSDNIVAFFNQEKPDCVALQEVLTNHAFSDFPSSDFIADNCDHTYRVFAPTYPRKNSKDREGNRTQRASYGQAFLSKHPIVSSESYFLKLYEEHPEENTVLFCDVEIEGRVVSFCNVHFANRTQFSELHLAELMELIQKRNVSPILLGDFNIWLRDMARYKSQWFGNYTISSDVDAYISDPIDNDTLDYIITPNAKYAMTNVQCHDEYVSDHKAVSATIDILV